MLLGEAIPGGSLVYLAHLLFLLLLDCGALLDGWPSLPCLRRVLAGLTYPFMQCRAKSARG